jgi:microcin C transport system substrate-binding protein
MLRRTRTVCAPSRRFSRAPLRHTPFPSPNSSSEKRSHAKSGEELITICHALDRVMLWQYYVIPHWDIGSYRIAFWDMFGHPQTMPKYGLDVVDAWWVDPAKAEKIIAAQKRNR